MNQIITKIEVYTCVQPGQYGGECGEVASYQVIAEGIKVSLCDIHADPYITGTLVLKAIKCTGCKGTCKPGFIVDRDSGYQFCKNECRDKHYVRNNRYAYR